MLNEQCSLSMVDMDMMDMDMVDMDNDMMNMDCARLYQINYKFAQITSVLFSLFICRYNVFVQCLPI